jgi:gamma-glutamylcyclotransferase (GGCT)/AIG2-like uncharacterized protein YtfP
MKLFVYGSLMLRSELERVLGRAYDGVYTPFALNGYRRDWSASDTGLAYLNLTPDPDAITRGFVLEIHPDDAERLDAQEPTYRRVRIGDFETYICRPEYRDKGSAVLRQYWLLVQSALGEPLPELPGHLTMTDQAEGADV